MDSLRREKLDRKWKKHADEIELEIIQKLQGNAAYHVIEVARSSFRRFSVERVGLRNDSFVLRLDAEAGLDEGRRSAGGWLCFESELDALYYLYHVWFRHVKTNFTDTDDPMAETIEVIERAIGIALREGEFGNDVLKDMIIRSIGRLALVSFSCGMHVSDAGFDMELAENVGGVSGHPELAGLATSGALDLQNQKHLKMLESWMSKT